MDRDDLLSLLGAMKDNVAVKPDGIICNLDTKDEWLISDVCKVAAELTDDLNTLIAWAKLAPKYEGQQ